MTRGSVMEAQKPHKLQDSRFDSSSSDNKNKDKPASEKQIKYLISLGYKGDINLTSRQANSLISDFVGGRKRR